MNEQWDCQPYWRVMLQCVDGWVSKHAQIYGNISRQKVKGRLEWHTYPARIDIWKINDIGVCVLWLPGPSSRLRWQSTAGQYLETHYWQNLWRNILWVHNMLKHTTPTHTAAFSSHTHVCTWYLNILITQQVQQRCAPERCCSSSHWLFICNLVCSYVQCFIPSNPFYCCLCCIASSET